MLGASEAKRLDAVLYGLYSYSGSQSCRCFSAQIQVLWASLLTLRHRLEDGLGWKGPHGLGSLAAGQSSLWTWAEIWQLPWFPKCHLVANLCGDTVVLMQRHWEESEGGKWNAEEVAVVLYFKRESRGTVLLISFKRCISVPIINISCVLLSTLQALLSSPESYHESLAFIP